MTEHLFAIQFKRKKLEKKYTLHIWALDKEKAEENFNAGQINSADYEILSIVQEAGEQTTLF